jgi:hypothetical protein
VDERERRMGENEVLFREVNERLESLNEAFSPLTEQMLIVCECADLSCIERIPVTLAEYEELRADPKAFAILSGHEAAEVDQIVAERDRYVIVRKRPGEAARVAVTKDPRNGGDTPA